MKKILMSILTADGKISSKRFITLMAFILMAFGFLMNMLLQYTVDANIFEALEWVVLGGLGFTASEKFSGKNKPDSNDDSLIN
jgi:hypothetical protein